MNPPDQGANEGAGRMLIDDMRTVGALRADAPGPDAVARLSDRALRAAVQNPDHSEAGRAAAAEALRARGISASTWNAATPGFLKARDLARGDGVFFGGGARLRKAMAGLSLLSFAALVAVLGLDVFGGVRAAPLVIGVLAGGAVGCAALWLLMSLLRMKPARLSVMLPEGPQPPALKRAIASELRGYGQVLTLTSRERGGAVHNAASYRAAAAALRNKLALNARTLLSDCETLALSADDGWRDLLVRLMAHSSDAVLVDLSAGPSWALGAIESERELARVLFISAWAEQETAEALLRERGIDALCFAYAPDGEIQRRGRFRAAMLAAMQAAQSS